MADCYIVTVGEYDDRSTVAVYTDPALLRAVLPAFPVTGLEPGIDCWYGRSEVKNDTCNVSVVRMQLDDLGLRFITDYHDHPVDAASIKEDPYG